MAATNDEAREWRRDVLHQWQRYYNMEPRDDSRLTKMFVDGEIGMSPDQVARELMAVDYLYRATLYGEIIEDFLRLVATRLREEYSLSWKATWNIVRFYGPIALKLMCVSSAHLAIPECMPGELL